MKEKFQGDVLQQAMREQKLFLNYPAQADKAALSCVVSEFPDRHVVITQGDDSWDVFFILQGKCEVLVNSAQVNVRLAGEHVGEMAALLRDRRTATIRCMGPVVVAQIAHDVWRKLADELPGLWRNAAETLARRLDERKKFHVEARPIPRIFVASSSSSVDVLDAVRVGLEKFCWEVRPWTSRDVFVASGTTIGTLLDEARQSDFAVAIFAPDDIAKIKDEEQFVTRDNVVFEAGLFTGAIGLPNTFVLRPKSPKIRIPSDLDGVTLLPYFKEDGCIDVSEAVEGIAAVVQRRLHC